MVLGNVTDGVRLIKMKLVFDDVKQHLRGLIKALFHTVPAGVGRTGKYKFDETDTKRILAEGPKLRHRPRRVAGFGSYRSQRPHRRRRSGTVSPHAIQRGSQQCGNPLRFGNDFLEVQAGRSGGRRGRGQASASNFNASAR